jgi:hypothetical protein
MDDVTLICKMNCMTRGAFSKIISQKTYEDFSVWSADYLFEPRPAISSFAIRS